MKKLRIVMSSMLCFGLSISNVSATNTDYLTEISNQTIQLVDTYKELGMTSGQLANIINATYKSDTQSYQRDLTLVIDDVNIAQSRVSIDGNPPIDDQETQERYNYINQVLAKEYNAEKYQDKQDKYFAYLYASHYIENTAYDRNNPNFANIRAHIICEEDIKAFDKFYSYTTGVSVMNGFTAMVETKENFDSLSDAQQKIARDIVVTSLIECETKAGVILQEMDSVGIFDTSNQIETMKILYDAYMSAVGTAKTGEEMVELMYSNIDGQHLPFSLVSSYANALFNLAKYTPVASFVWPVVVGVSYFTDTLSKAFSMAALGGLYYSGQARRADRVAIELGLFPRP